MFPTTSPLDLHWSQNKTRVELRRKENYIGNFHQQSENNIVNSGLKSVCSDYSFISGLNREVYCPHQTGLHFNGFEPDFGENCQAQGHLSTPGSSSCDVE